MIVMFRDETLVFTESKVVVVQRDVFFYEYEAI